MIRQFFPILKQSANIDDIIPGSFLNQALMPVFSSESIDFINEISKNIFKDNSAAAYPELSALAFFFRKSNIHSIIEQVNAGLNKSVILSPRGIGFHIAPSNVDTIFAYSWALSLLAGNLNIVRISSKLNQQVQILLDLIKNTGAKSQFSEIAQRNIVINYEHDDRINERLSAIADMRIIWGGDATISLIRSFKPKPTAKEIVFADKVSYSVIDSLGYLQFDEKALAGTASAFYNDGYYFGQMGCSSPRIVYFAGNNENNIKASGLFWSKLSEYMKKKGHADDISVALNKHIEIFEKAADDVTILAYQNTSDSEPTVIRIDTASAANARETCGGGFFYECFVDSLNDISPLVRSNDQTMTYTGFNRDIMKEFAEQLIGKGIDRIVPVGSALNFAPVWDGYNLALEFTKSISVL